MAYTFNGTTAEDLNIKRAVVSWVGAGEDTCEITITRERVRDDLPWEYGQTVAVNDGERLVFQGTAMSPRVSGFTVSYTIKGAWWKLVNNVYLQPDPLLSNQAPSAVSATRMLFTDHLGEGITTRKQLEQVLDAAQRSGILTGYDGLGAMVDGIYPAPEQVVSRSYADVIRTILRYHPDVMVSSSPSGVLRFGRRGELGAKVFNYGQAPLQSCVLQARPDLAPAGVIIRYTRRGAAQGASGFVTALSTDSYPGGCLPGDANVIVADVMLESDQEITPGMASRYYHMFRPTMYEGDLTFVDQRCEIGLLPGMMVQVNGLDGSPQAMVVSVKEDLMMGRTSVQCGLPGHLGIQDMLDILKLGRWRNRDVGLAEPPSQTVAVPDTDFTPYMDYVNRVPVLRVTPGTVDDGKHDYVAEWETGNIRLDDAPAPYAEIPRGADYDVWLRVVFEPEIRSFSVALPDGSVASQWRAVGIASIKSLQVRFSTLDDYVAPQVTPDRGEVTDGVRYYKLGTVVWPLSDALPTVTATRTGSFNLHYVPPGRLYRVEPALQTPS